MVAWTLFEFVIVASQAVKIIASFCHSKGTFRMTFDSLD